MNIKLIIISIITSLFFLFPPMIHAYHYVSSRCDGDPAGIHQCVGDFCTGHAQCPSLSTGISYCEPNTSGQLQCSGLKPGINTVFGRIRPPEALQNLGIGSAGISKFLSNLIFLIYVIATVVFVFMLLWGAFQWLTSGGEKEAVEEARGRIIHALIGITLFAIAYAVIQVVGLFTGFTFFVPKGISQCEDIFYYDNRPGIQACIHKYATSQPCRNDKEYVFERVDLRFCGK